MNTQIEEVFELFQTLLINLNLPEDIFGYSACLLLLCIVLAVKTIILNCVLKKVKNCITATGQFDTYDIEIV